MSERQKQYPLISIVILNWNGLEDTKTCLEHVWKLDYPNYEVVVVDNGSREDSKQYLSKLDGIIYVDNPTNRGFTGGHIDGLTHCSGEYIVLLNNDAVMKYDYLEKALEHFDDPGVAVVGGRAYSWSDDQPLLSQNNSFYSYQDIDVYTGEAHTQSHDLNATQEVNNVSGSCVVVRRKAIEEVGYLYDRFFAYFEETDLFARMKRAGYKVLYDPRLQIWHRVGASSGASSGSYFFYYQIFRNRFIFATRNFETAFMLRFWLIYAKIAAESGLRWTLRRGDSTMHKAYFKAALYNLVTLPVALGSRLKLRSKLGKSSYNHKIYSEQTGTSIVIDCSDSTERVITNLSKQIAQDKHPLHEYVLIARHSSKSLPPLPANARYVIDKGYFDVPAVNLGCLVARFSWMLVCTAEDFPTHEIIDSSIPHSFDEKVRLLAYRDVENRRAPFIFIHKALYEFTGGFAGKSSIQKSIDNLINYAQRIKKIKWQPMPPGEYQLREVAKLSSREAHDLDQVIKFDEHLLSSKSINWFGRLQNRYYRIYQLVTLINWLFLWRIPIRLKLARIKNLVLFTLTIKVRSLALELKHMHNEVLLYGGRHFVVNEQQQRTKLELKNVATNLCEIPVFIICFERVDALKQLVTWLEKRGMKNIVFIDNDSSYPPLLKYYERSPYQVLRLMRNIGHTAPWSLSIIRSLVPHSFYIVSDPDVIPTENCPKDFLSHFLEIHAQFFAYQKVGFGLKIDDLPDHYKLKEHVIEWESQFWKHTLGNEIYEASLDTTFALYKPFTYTYKLHPSIRTGEPYVARHLPWYHNPSKDTDEDAYYRFRADSNVNTWNLGELPERYKKEMA